MANRFLSNIKINDAYTFPASDGTNGQFIATDGAGNLSFQSAGEAGATVIYKDLFTGDASTLAFTLANSVDNEVKTQVYFDGVYQSKENYTVSGSAITFSTAPPSGAAIEVITFATVAAADYNQKLNFYGKAVGTITKGDAVMFAGAQGDHFLIAKATQSALAANHEYFLGLAAQDFSNNQYGYVTQFGRLEAMDTSDYTAGDILWFDSEGTTAGAVTTTEPSAPNTKIQIAAVVRVHQEEGVIFVRPTVYHTLSEQQDVSVTSVADKDLLAWNTSTGVWENTKTLGNITTGNINVAGLLYVPDNIIHTGDNGTNIQFDSGQLRVNTGGVPRISITDASVQVTNPFVASSTITALGGNSTQWNTAYGWGDHSIVGYLTSFTETDPIYTGSSWYTTTNNSTNWNTAYGWGNHANAGYQAAATAITTSNIGSQSVNYATSAGAVYGNQGGSFGLNDTKLYLRTNGDNNHYLWNAADDWEELNAYEGTGLRITSVGGSTGILYVYGSSNGGYTYSPYSFRAPIFYDSNDTGYYVDPASTSSLNGLTVAGTITGSVSGSAGSVAWSGVSSKPAGWLDAATLSQGNEPNTNVPSGFYESYLGAGNPTGTWFSYINVRHTNPSNGHGYQLGMSFYDNNLWFRSYQGGIPSTYQSWEHAIGSGGSSQTKSGILQSDASLRAPIFYDSNDTGYYVDPNGNSVLTTALFNVNASSTITLTSAGTNASMIKAGAGDELYIGGNDTWQMRFNGGNVLMDNGGYLQNNTSLRAPIFYDYNDTGYYLNPNGYSQLNHGNFNSAPNGRSLSLGGDDNSRVYNDTNRNSLVINAPYYPHLYINAMSSASNSVHGPVFSMTGTLTAGGFRRWGMGIANTDPDCFSWGYYDNERNPHYGVGGTFGYTGTNSKMWLNTGGSLMTTGDMRAPIFYDSNDTGYYVDAASTSRINEAQFDRIGVGQGTNSNYRIIVSGDYYANAGGNYWAEGRFKQYRGSGTWHDVIDSGNIGSQSVSYATTARELTTNYAGGQQLNPQTYFNINYGLKVAMTAAWSVWSDTLWINGYAGGDVLQMCALHTLRNGQPRIAISAQASNGTSYGTIYELWSSYNMDAPNKSGTSYYQTNTWMQFNGDYGLYWPSQYDAHFSPNNLSGYTQFALRGSKNSYGGIYDNYSKVNGFMYDSGGNGGIYRQDNGRWYLYHLVSNNCTGINTSTTSSSYGLYVEKGIYSTGDITAYSDVRKKTNIATIDSALDKVTKLRGVYYDRIDDLERGRQIGVIAQEVNEVLPEAVTYAEDIDEYGVKYGNIVGVLIEAIKELSKKVEELENKLNGNN